MRILLDTHVWLWMRSAPERLAAPARARLEDGANELFLSVASAWEIAIKYRLGKLRLPEPPARFIPGRMVALRVAALPVELRHTFEVAVLPMHHADPFDRLLVAQARVDRLRLCTADRSLAAYDVELLEA